ncbi:MAG: RDD family protein [Treponema sp.]|nr:RDD family protein [Treponema sp.]
MNNKRIIAGTVDFLVAGLLQTIFMMNFLLMPMLSNPVSLSIPDFMARNIIITYSSITFLVIRDILGVKSIGKRIMKLKVIDKNTENEAIFICRFLRNITWLLGPVEIIVLLITKTRIGDKIAGTTVVEV